MDPADLEELHAGILEYREQLAEVAGVIAEHPENEEAQQIHAELSEALAAAEAAYTDCCVPSAANADNTKAASDPAQLQQPQQQHPAQYHNMHAAAAPAENSGKPASAAQQLHATSAAAAASSTRVPAAAALAHPARSMPRMHPANLYCQQEPDFAALAELHPPLAPYVSVHPVTGRASIDFTSWHATQQLTAALLAVDFGIDWSLPEGQLVPPVPNRANYVHWLHDLLQLSAPSGPQVRGLDIGCGANFIYCLLGAALYGWHMTGVDITQVALHGAAAICDANPQLAHLLEVRQSRCSVGQLPQQQQQQQQLQQDQLQDLRAGAVVGPLLGAMGDARETFAFCMCNPPFFGSIHEANQNPNTACGGTAEEMVVEGGELAFVRAIVADSRVLRSRIHWYSSMCGKKATLKMLRQELHSAGVTALRTTELVQGKTSRWAIAWSFAASPNTANMPLPRRDMPQQQQQRQPPPQQQQQHQGSSHQQRSRSKRAASSAAGATKLSFRVTAPAADGRRLLQALAALLTTVGQAQGVQVDTAAWKVHCQLAAGASPQQQQQQQQPEEEQLSNAGTTEHEPASKRISSGLKGRAISGEATAGMSTGVSSSAGAHVVAAGYAPVEVSVFQQQRGIFDVVAALKGELVEQLQQLAGAAAALLLVVEAVREDLTLMWPVSPLQLL